MTSCQSKFEAYSNLVKSSNGRDKVIRLCSYCSRLLGVLASRGGGRSSSPGAAAGPGAMLGSIADRLNACRVILRLFDDIPMALFTKSYGWGHTEKHPIMSLLGVASNIVNQLFYPVEHIAWLGELRLVPVNVTRWQTWSVAVWAISLLISIIRNCLTIYGLRVNLKRLNKRQSMNLLEARDSAATSSTDEQIHLLRRTLHTQTVELVRNVADMMNAVHWLPKGFLWAGQLSPLISALFGTTSSVGFVYLAIANQKSTAASGKSKD
ncbi:peroxisomal membrane protein 11C-like [Tubulanus polymorphus]|uniref:peroxisomal membrane protein 11C-like n=1 Tax=Tubulanus polymorphus TaxID=672921 RepID=UPI003DA31C01